MQNKNKVYTAQGYWETTIGTNYAIEFEKYKRLCGYSYKKKVIRTIYGKEWKFISYREWEQDIICTVSILDVNELNEYSWFLNRRIRDKDVIFTLSQTLLTPFIIYFMGMLIDIFLKPTLQPVLDVSNPIVVIIFAFFIIIMFFPILYKLLSARNDNIQKHFFEDMKEIVDARIRDMEQPK